MLPVAAAPTARAAAQEQNKSDQLEQMARRKFGALSNAELLLLRSAPQHEIKWASPRDDRHCQPCLSVERSRSIVINGSDLGSL